MLVERQISEAARLVVSGTADTHTFEEASGLDIELRGDARILVVGW